MGAEKRTVARKRLTASERDAMLRMNIVLEILDTEAAKLSDRLKDIPYAKRDIGMMKAKIYKLIAALTETIPDDQLMHWMRMLKTATYYVGTRNPNDQNKNEGEFGYWLSVKTIKTLLEGVHDKCLMCDLDKGQRRACKLRKAIDSIPNDTPDREDGDCHYYGIL